MQVLAIKLKLGHLYFKQVVEYLNKIVIFGIFSIFVPSGVPAHQLSATRLLSSPDPSRHHLEDPPGCYIKYLMI